jgi:predicted nucleic acid-binding protein
VTRYLVDTNVISTTAPTTGVKRPELVEWMDSHSPNLFLSAVTIAEITEGIAKARREGAKRKARALADLARGRGHSPGFADIAIAATARRHDLTILVIRAILHP